MKVGILMRMLRYMAPSKGKILMVLVVSMLTSLFSVVSIYSILPLLNAVFSSGSTSTATTPGTPLQQTAQFSKSLSRAEEVKTWALNEFQRMFDAPTKQLTLLKICFFLILACLWPIC